ncbi:hypothetical protein B0H17DRAFT_520292 [Mycena rosella]|uniref:Uncharacterized protein n=1 Tax=Mycena rosella TaxID=1033263 RepID=A0AAD7GXJ9_MYCRO|nr:hypothetical protein B0H17DRAFT_520292 [Mycena rosella]
MDSAALRGKTRNRRYQANCIEPVAEQSTAAWKQEFQQSFCGTKRQHRSDRSRKDWYGEILLGKSHFGAWRTQNIMLLSGAVRPEVGRKAGSPSRSAGVHWPGRHLGR